jgi:hypothetical protein
MVSCLVERLSIIYRISSLIATLDDRNALDVS